MMASDGDTQEFTELTPVTILNGDGEETEVMVLSSKGTNHIKQEINNNVRDNAGPLEQQPEHLLYLRIRIRIVYW